MKVYFRIFLLILALGILTVSCGKKDEPAKEECKVTIDKTTFKPGEEITVTFTAQADFDKKAWIGIIPSEVKHGDEAENDNNDLAYQYLEGKTGGKLTFKAPEKPGKYDFRMNSADNNGKEVATVSFTVEAPPEAPASITLEKMEFTPNEEINVTFTSPALPAKAWIGIIPSEVPHGEEAVNDQHDLTYQYLEGKTSGTLKYIAPEKKGSYDFRMNSDDANGKEIFSITFQVK